MALRSKWDSYPQVITELANKVLNQGQRSQIIKVAQTNYVDLLEKFTDPRISQLGSVVLDHVTFYISDVIDTFNTTGNSVKKGNKFGSKLTEYKNEFTYIADTKQNEYKRLSSWWNGEKTITITLDNIFITVNRTPNIITTLVKGDEGSFKQYTNKGDYQITFSGTLAGTNEYQGDVDKIRRLSSLFSLSNTIKVSSIYLNNIYGISDIAITSFNFDQDTKFSNLDNFNITALSDLASYTTVEPVDIKKYIP